MTNHERIKQMTAEELAAALKAFQDCSANCPMANGKKNCDLVCLYEDRIVKWLESKVIR